MSGSGGTLLSYITLRRCIQCGVALCIVSLIFFCLISSSCVRISDARYARDSDTGLLMHAAPRTLGNPEADIAVLMVHGFLGTPHHFETLPEAVADAGYFTHVMLLPGHGTSPLALEQTNGVEMTLAVRETVNALREDHEQVVVLGHSMGAALSVLAAGLTSVDGLILAAPLFEVEHRWYYGMHPERWAKVVRPFLRWVYRGPGSRPVKRREVRRDITTYTWAPTTAAYAAVQLGQEARSMEALAHLDMPVLLIHGAEDSITSPEAAEAALEAMPTEDKTLLLLDNSEHLLFWDYDRDKARDAILDFLARLAA